MTGQIWVTNSLGGFAYSDKLSRELRMAVQPGCKFRQFCDAHDATRARTQTGEQLGKGDLFHWNVYSDVANQGGTLVETTTVPETSFTISQGTLTVTEYGNSVPYTGKLDDLSEQPIREIIKKVLKNDARKAIDNDAFYAFNDCLLRAGPTGGTSTTAITLSTGGTCTTTNSNVALQTGHVKAIVDTMKERNIPPYIDDDYICIARPTGLRGLKNGLESLQQYTETGFSLIYKGEIGRYENTRFVEQTHIPAGGAEDENQNNHTAWSAWNGGSSGDWAVFMGEDTVAEGLLIMEEIRGKIPTDYGRSKGIMWYALTGFAIVHTAAAQQRILKWTSAV